VALFSKIANGEFSRYFQRKMSYLLLWDCKPLKRGLYLSTSLLSPLGNAFSILLNLLNILGGIDWTFQEKIYKFVLGRLRGHFKFQFLLKPFLLGG
jgi:hypothetical protein